MRYTGYRDRPQEERQIRFQNGCREGHSEIAFTNSGTNLQIVFNLSLGPYHPEREVDFDKEHGKVSDFDSLWDFAGNWDWERNRRTSDSEKSDPFMFLATVC